MSSENRQMPRYRDFARAWIEDLSQLPGVLEDVSKTGCKVRFSHVFPVDSDREYLMTVHPACRSGIREFELVVRPEWVRERDNSLDIGFSILHSPGSRSHHSYIELLSESEDELFEEACQ